MRRHTQAPRRRRPPQSSIIKQRTIEAGYLISVPRIPACTKATSVHAAQSIKLFYRRSRKRGGNSGGGRNRLDQDNDAFPLSSATLVQSIARAVGVRQRVIETARR